MPKGLALLLIKCTMTVTDLVFSLRRAEEKTLWLLGDHADALFFQVAFTESFGLDLFLSI